jgi:MFS family permease
VNLIESLIPSDFRRAIDAPLRRFFIGIFVSCFAMGLTLALYVVYLHNVHGFSTGFSTLLLAGASLAGLVTAPIWGTMTDRIGPVKVLLVAGVTDAGALVYWAYIHSETSAVLGALLLAIFGGAGWGPGSTLLVRLVAPEHRQRAYGFNFMLVNFGMGFGGLVSAAVVDLHHPLTFRWLYLGNAVVSLSSGVFFVSLWKYGSVDHAFSTSANARTRSDGWRVVVRDRRLVLFVAASLVLMLGGYSAVDAGLSLFVVNNLHMSVHVIGVILFVNTTTIVLAQLFVLNLIEGRSRTRVLASVAVLWFIFWVVLGLAESMSETIAIVAISLAMMVFAIGETMLSPVGPAIVNEIAPEHLRGRYNAAQGLTWGLSGTLAPAITAAFFDNGLSQWWPLSVGVVSLLGGALMLNLRRHLSVAEDGRHP